MGWYERTDPSWLGPNWRDQTHAWIDAKLAEHGHERTGDVSDIHVNVWSTVLTAPTSGGQIYFKTTGAGFDHEPALFLALEALGVAGLRVAGVDVERRWLMTWGEGKTVRETFGAGPGALESWRRMLRSYAELQIRMADHDAALLATGLPDMRLTTLPERLEEMLGFDTLVAEGCLTAQEHRALASLGPKLAQRAEEVAAIGIPETLQHNDLHDSNVFVRDDEFVVFDWGDASFSHPFFDLEVLHNVARYRFGLEPPAPAFHALFDTYLEPFQVYGLDIPALREAVVRVWPLAKLCRAMTWFRVVRLPGGDEARKLVSSRLRVLLEAL